MSEKEKMNVNTAPAADTSTGTAEDVEAIMKKYDRESNTRIWEGVPKTGRPLSAGGVCPVNGVYEPVRQLG